MTDYTTTETTVIIEYFGEKLSKPGPPRYLSNGNKLKEIHEKRIWQIKKFVLCNDKNIVGRLKTVSR